LTTHERGRPEIDLQLAVDDGVVEIELDGAVRFTHPLLAAAIVEVATPDERRNAHLELAALATDEVEAARHTALAAPDTDPSAADAAARAFELASERGLTASALELSELALRLTPSEQATARLQRTGAYAECLDSAGAVPEARAVLEREIAAGPPGTDRSRLLTKLGWICWRDGDSPTGIARAIARSRKRTTSRFAERSTRRSHGCTKTSSPWRKRAPGRWSSCASSSATGRSSRGRDSSRRTSGP